MIAQILDRLRAEDNFRTLPDLRIEGKYLFHEGKRYLNLSSNDYLGITDESWQEEFMEEILAEKRFMLSNPSSRLITGNSPEYRQLEATLSELFSGREALVLGSGYLVNSGVLPALTTKKDLILADKLIHASLIDGLRLSEADMQRFAHNDLEHLERLLRKLRSRYENVWIATESIFSMDGDIAPLREIVALKRQYDCRLYVDEAHAFGVCGPDGRGIAAQTGVMNDCDILIATLGKAIASQGAFVISDPPIRDFLINRMRTLIFSTALPPISLRWTDRILHRLPEMEGKRQQLRTLSRLITGTDHSTHIIPLMAGENHRAIEMSRQMREAGFWVMPIRYPTVPKGSARVRVSLSATLPPEEITRFAELWKNAGW